MCEGQGLAILATCIQNGFNSHFSVFLYVSKPCYGVWCMNVSLDPRPSDGGPGSRRPRGVESR